MNAPDSLQQTARRAGLLYLVLLVLGPYEAIYIPNTFIVAGDAAATAQKIITGELVYRLGAFTSLVCNVVFLALALTLYQLFKGVHRGQARLMVALVGVSSAIAVANLVNRFAPLIFLNPQAYLTVFTTEQLQVIALTFIRLSRLGMQITMVFWGLWLLPFGFLTIHSGFLPKWLGWLLIVGGVTYTVLGFTFLVLPTYGSMLARVAPPLYAAGELVMIFWLLFMKLPPIQSSPATP